MKTLKRTSTNEYKRAIYAYLISCIDLDGYVEGVTADMSDRDKVIYLMGIIKSEHDHELKRYGLQKTVAAHFQGLGCGHPAFENWRILEVAKRLHEVETLTERQEDIIIAQWFNHCALHFVKMWEGYESGKLK